MMTRSLAVTTAKRSLLLGCAFLVAACGTLSKDPRVRTPGTMLDDQVLETVVKRQIRSAVGGLKGNHVVVVSYNGVVLLAGQVASDDIRTKAEAAASSLAQVRRVHNELIIGGPISYVSRSNDGWITTKVKTKLLANKESHANQIKVVTENGVVYLMGMLLREEADQAVQVTKSVYGVQKIVKVFEYLNENSPTPQELHGSTSDQSANTLTQAEAEIQAP